ncbi:MAG: UDP-3-O-acyl-N-acetylglucosamine deacetylase, partial [Nitrospirae bacterium]|nr:UDP-3-O-acyl-N-acetylglucosamine deacetylase [Nitrospirota bacterium]
MRLQRTLKREITFGGVGLHTGRHSTVRLKPAARDTGIVFYRSDKAAIIRPNINSVIDTAFATTIGFNGVKIRTVEHLLAALAGLGIDNLFIEVNGPEIPILDGSSQELVRIILEAGIAKQASEATYLKILRPVIYKDSHSKIAGLPFDGRRISYYINFSH